MFINVKHVFPNAIVVEALGCCEMCVRSCSQDLLTLICFVGSNSLCSSKFSWGESKSYHKIPIACQVQLAPDDAGGLGGLGQWFRFIKKRFKGFCWSARKFIEVPGKQFQTFEHVFIPGKGPRGWSFCLLYQLHGLYVTHLLTSPWQNHVNSDANERFQLQQVAHSTQESRFQSVYRLQLFYQQFALFSRQLYNFLLSSFQFFLWHKLCFRRETHILLRASSLIPGRN